MISVQGKRFVLYTRRSRRPLQDRTEYRCTGPDGTVFVNTTKASLGQLLRRRYPGVKVEWVVSQ